MTTTVPKKRSLHDKLMAELGYDGADARRERAVKEAREAERKRTRLASIRRGPPAPSVALDGVPTPKSLGSFKEYSKLTDRVAELRARLLTNEQRLHALEGERLQSSVSTVNARSLLHATKMPSGKITAAMPEGRSAEETSLLKDNVLIRQAVAEGERELDVLGRQLSGKAVEPLLEWHAEHIAKMAGLAVEMARLWSIEHAVMTALEDGGLAASALAPCGPTRPPFADPGRVASWIAWLLETDALPREKRWVEASQQETPAAR